VPPPHVLVWLFCMVPPNLIALQKSKISC
jgi:hypothetical protein